MTDKKTETESKFTKQELVKSNKFIDRVDTLTVVLEDGKAYTVDVAEKLIEKFLKGRVN